MSYTRTNWKDYPEKATPVNADNLNNMEDGIEAAINIAGELKKQIEECLTPENVVGTGSKTLVASSSWVQNLEMLITNLQGTHKKDVDTLQTSIDKNTTRITNNQENISEIKASYALSGIETFEETDLTESASAKLEFGGKTIGTSNTGNYLIIMFRRSKSYGENTGSVWLAAIRDAAASSYALRLLKGGSNSEPSLKVASNGDLRIFGTGTSGAVCTGIIFRV